MRMASGKPYLANTCLKQLIVVDDVKLRNGNTSTNLENISMMTNMNLSPFGEVGNGPMKSAASICIGESNRYGLSSAETNVGLTKEQTLHVFTKPSTSTRIPGQK